LDEAARRLPDPPIDVLERQAVLEWVQRASARIAFREDRRRIAREAMRILDRDFQTAMNVDRLRGQLARQEADRCARRAGTYWAQRDERRTAQQPTHVDVDLDAWRSMRAEATRRGLSVGQAVGHVVVQEVARCASGPTLPALRDARRGARGEGRSATLFARVVVTKPTWLAFRSFATVRDVTVARYVGVLVEQESDTPARPPK
jgi:hypothetical protein